MPDEEEIFAQALIRGSPSERASYLAQACGGDTQLRASVESLLAAYERRGGGAAGAAGGILEIPPPRFGFDDDDATDVQAAEHVGATIGPHKLLQQLGEGGMGVVYLAEQMRPVRRAVAIKIIKPGLDSKQVIARFEAERQALALMDHPNIAKVFDAGTTETGRPYFVMELVRGIPITEYCDQHQLTPRQRLELFIPVCQAVQHAHQKGIIHRDLKPTNVLITLQDGDKPTPKVIDFGIAKATAGQRLTERTLFTEFRQLIGTPLYMSPEQAEMSAVMDVDTRSDVYSLGVLLYELLTGTTPFDKKRLATAAFDEVRRIIREEEPPRPSTRLSTMGDVATTVSASRSSDPKKLSQTIRGELDWIVMKALEKERSRRYETASALARDVERYLGDETVEACPPSRLYRLRKFVRRNKTAIGTALVILVVLICATAVSTWEAVRAHRAERQVTRERDQAQTEKRRADEQAAVAQAVSDFLDKDVLAQAGPSYQATPDFAPDPDLTVRDALDRAASRATESFHGRPLVEAAIHQAIGTAYGDLGEFTDKAVPHLEAALRLRRELLGPTDPLTLDTEETLGMAYAGAARPKNAAEELGQVLKARRQVLGERHPDTLLTMSDLARVDRVLSRYEEAESLCLQVLQNDHSKPGEEGPAVVGAQIALAAIYHNQGRHAKSLPLYKAVFEHMQKHYGPQSPQALDAMGHVAMSYSNLGNPTEAETLYLQAIEGLRKAFGERNYDTQKQMRNLAITYCQENQPVKAEQLLLHVIDLQREMYGDRYPTNSTSLYTRGILSGVYMNERRFDDAEALLLRILDEEHKKYPGPTIRTAGQARTMERLGHVYEAKREPEKAEKFLVEALEAQRRVNGVDDEETLSSAGALGNFYVRQRRYDLAEPLLLEAEAGWRKREHEVAARSFAAELVYLYEKWNRPVQAAAWRAKLPATRPATVPSSAPTSAKTAASSAPVPTSQPR